MKPVLDVISLNGHGVTVLNTSSSVKMMDIDTFDSGAVHLDFYNNFDDLFDDEKLD